MLGLAKFRFGKQFKDLEALQAEEIKDNYETGGVRPIVGPDGKIAKVATPTAGEKTMSETFGEQSKVSAAMGEFVQALRKGSYDIRNIPEMSATSKGFPKFGIALVAGVAAGVRMGFKKGTGVENYGTPQKDILKDIGNTITESLKNAKINVGGGGHGGDDHAKEVKSVGH